jgi:hypothetical protein
MKVVAQNWPWSVLDLPGKSAEGDVRRAYARKLKTIDQANDIEGFTALRMAYDFALRISKSAKPAVQFPDPAQIEASPSPQVESALAMPAATLPSEPVPAAEPTILAAVEPVPPPDPPAPREPTKWERFEALKATAKHGTPWASAHHTVMTLLNDPLAQDDEIGPMIRRLIRDFIVEGISKNGGEWPDSLGRSDVIALDRAYRWLSDYRSAKTDFRGRDDILHMMVEAAELRRQVNPEAQAALERRGQLARRGAYVVPALAFIGFSFASYLAMSLAIALRGGRLNADTLGIVIWLSVIAGALLAKIFSKRLRPVWVKSTLPVFDHLDMLRERYRRFSLSSYARTTIMIGWIFALVALSRFIGATSDPTAKWVASTLLVVGLIHEIIQAWLNSGRR